MIKPFRFPIAFLLLISLCGCTTWQYIDDNGMTWKGGPGFEARLPRYWVKASFPKQNNLLFMSKDGIPLQNIKISKLIINKEDVFPKTKKKITEDMMLHEVADLFLNEMSLDKEKYMNLQIIGNEPVDIGGVEGFRLEYSYNNVDYLKYRIITYGFLYKKKFYLLTYKAAQQHYFKDGVNDFKRFVRSFRTSPDRMIRPERAIVEIEERDAEDTYIAERERSYKETFEEAEREVATTSFDVAEEEFLNEASEEYVVEAPEPVEEYKEVEVASSDETEYEEAAEASFEVEEEAYTDEASEEYADEMRDSAKEKEYEEDVEVATAEDVEVKEESYVDSGREGAATYIHPIDYRAQQKRKKKPKLRGIKPAEADRWLNLDK